MRKMCCLLLVLLFVLPAAGCGKESAPQSYEYTKSETVYVTETENLQMTIEVGCLEDQNDRDWAVYNLQKACNSALTFLDELSFTMDEPIQCTIHAGDGLTEIQAGEMDIYFYETVDQPYINYMLQALLGTDAPDWLREGLAAYGADQMGESLLNSYGLVLTELDGLRGEESDVATPAEKDITALATILHQADTQEEALLLGDMLQTMSQMETAEEAAQYRGAYCIYAGSFVEYLAEEKGLASVINVYQGEEFSSVMGKPFSDFQKAWIADTFTNESYESSALIADGSQGYFCKM